MRLVTTHAEFTVRHRFRLENEADSHLTPPADCQTCQLWLFVIFINQKPPSKKCSLNHHTAISRRQAYYWVIEARIVSLVALNKSRIVLNKALVLLVFQAQFVSMITATVNFKTENRENQYYIRKPSMKSRISDRGRIGLIKHCK